MNFDRDFFRVLLDNLDVGVYFVNKDRRILYWNRGAQRITGYEETEVVGKCCSDNLLIHVDELGNRLCFTCCPLVKSIANCELQSADVYLHHKDGHRVPVSVNISPIQDSDGNIVGAVEVFTDSSSKKDVSAKIEELQKAAYLDPLTELPNRRYLEQSLLVRYEKMLENGSRFGVVMMDIDNFKKINDLYGHDVGDRVLKMVSKTLLKNSRAIDIVGRWGGEEFLAIISDATEDELAYITNRLHSLVEQSVIFIGQDSIRVTLSAGATIVRKDDAVESLIKRADRLMYESKNNGRNKVSVGA